MKEKEKKETDLGFIFSFAKKSTVLLFGFLCSPLFSFVNVPLDLYEYCLKNCLLNSALVCVCVCMCVCVYVFVCVFVCALISFPLSTVKKR